MDFANAKNLPILRMLNPEIYNELDSNLYTKKRKEDFCYYAGSSFLCGNFRAGTN